MRNGTLLLLVPAALAAFFLVAHFALGTVVTSGGGPAGPTGEPSETRLVLTRDHGGNDLGDLARERRKVRREQRLRAEKEAEEALRAGLIESPEDYTVPPVVEVPSGLVRGWVRFLEGATRPEDLVVAAFEPSDHSWQRALDEALNWTWIDGQDRFSLEVPAGPFELRLMGSPEVAPWRAVGELAEGQVLGEVVLLRTVTRTVEIHAEDGSEIWEPGRVSFQFTLKAGEAPFESAVPEIWEHRPAALRHAFSGENGQEIELPAGCSLSWKAYVDGRYAGTGELAADAETLDVTVTD